MTQYELCVNSDLANLATVSDFVLEKARQAGVDEDDAYDIQIAVDEACTNAIEHSYAGAQNGEVQICCYVEGADFVVRVSDFGAKFNPDDVPVPDLDAPLEDRPVGGLGLHFMRTLMDSVDYRPVDQGNVVMMRKRRRGNKR